MFACFYIGLNIGKVNHAAFKAAGTLFIFLGILVLPVFLIFLSQIVAGFGVLKQCEQLRGGNGKAIKGYAKNNYNNNYQQNAN
jgi:hypothetical protein